MAVETTKPDTHIFNINKKIVIDFQEETIELLKKNKKKYTICTIISEK